MVTVHQQITYASINEKLKDNGLILRGGFKQDDQTTLLIGPDEPAFWKYFRNSSEYQDGLPDPMDRFSKRVIGQLSSEINSKAVYPSDGPPYAPFYSWAVLTGKAFVSPLKLLVHEDVGLMISYRGALILYQSIEIPINCEKSPCETCREPCKSACPVDAFKVLSYDSSACKSYLSIETGQHMCSENGCHVRTSCPLSATNGRHPEQTKFHMKAFLKK